MLSYIVLPLVWICHNIGFWCLLCSGSVGSLIMSAKLGDKVKRTKSELKIYNFAKCLEASIFLDISFLLRYRDTIETCVFLMEYSAHYCVFLLDIVRFSKKFDSFNFFSNVQYFFFNFK